MSDRDRLLLTVRRLLEALEVDAEYWTMEEVDRYHAWIAEAQELVAEIDRGPVR